MTSVVTEERYLRLVELADPGQDRVGRARREAVWLAGAQLSASTA